MSWIRAFGESDYFSAQIRSVFYDWLDLQSEMSSFTEALEKLAMFFSFRQIVDGVVKSRPPTIPYESKDGGMSIEFKLVPQSFETKHIQLILTNFTQERQISLQLRDPCHPERNLFQD